MRRSRNLRASVYWLIWASSLLSVLVLQLLVGGGIPTGENQYPPPKGILSLCIAVISLSTVIRWLAIPRFHQDARMLFAFVVGLACAESAPIFNLFLISDGLPETKLSLLVLSLLAIAQFAPVFLKPKGKAPLA